MKIDWRDDLSNDLGLNLQQALHLKNRLSFVSQMVKDLRDYVLDTRCISGIIAQTLNFGGVLWASRKSFMYYRLF